MFLCEECHKEANCQSFSCELAVSGGMGGSFGACERCHREKICTDCHQYNFTSLHILEAPQTNQG